VKSKYFYGYHIVAASFVIQAVCIGPLFTYGVFFKQFQAELGWSRAIISGASSLAFFIMGAGGILAGRLNDRIGPRIIMVVSGTSLGLGYLLMAHMQAPWQLYFLYGIMVGIGFSTHDVITLSTVARWFIKRRGMMSGIVKVGTGAGQLLVPLIAAALIAAYGWRHAYTIIGATALVILVATALLLRRDPAEKGQFPDGNSADADGSASATSEPNISIRKAVRKGSFWILCVAEFTIFFCLLTMVVHIVPHATDLGLSPATAAGVLATIGGVSMVGRISMGTANDKIGGKRSLTICFIILLSGLCWLQIADKAWMLFLFAAVYGFSHGGFFTVMSPLVAELFGTGSHGLLFGLILFSGTIGGTVGPVLAGRMFDVVGSYQGVFWVLIGLALTGLIMILMLGPLQKADSTT
jgi:MFS family permease